MADNIQVDTHSTSLANKELGECINYGASIQWNTIVQ